MQTKHYLIKGLVQGVYYRASARKTAEALGLTGWVRNTPHGDVEAIASGDEKSLEKFATWCRQDPPAAKVSIVEITLLPEQTFAGFVIRR
jgi:acylphosphatase